MRTEQITNKTEVIEFDYSLLIKMATQNITKHLKRFRCLHKRHLAFI